MGKELCDIEPKGTHFYRAACDADTV